MKRLLAALLGLSVLWSRIGEARAQGAAGSQAQVFSVPTAGEARRFQVPQVKLPDAVVARRINRALMRHFRNRSFGEVDSTLSPRQQLREAVRQCCFDEDSHSWMAAGQGLSNTEYGVLLNQNFLLSLSFLDSYQGLEQPGGPHLTFDLRTGRQLTLGELVADPPAQLGRRLEAAISRRLRDELGQVVERYGDDSTRIDDVARLYNIETWDTTPRRGLLLDTQGRSDADDSQAHYTNFEFALTPEALLLFYTVGMSRLNFEFLPDDIYTFPWARLQPRPVLQPLVQAAATGSKTPKRR
jgi:hypothetical protein